MLGLGLSVLGLGFWASAWLLGHFGEPHRNSHGSTGFTMLCRAFHRGLGLCHSWFKAKRRILGIGFEARWASGFVAQSSETLEGLKPQTLIP